MSATIKLEKKHYPVLLNELISIISPLYGGTFIDCTFGQGGYSKKILENNLNSIIALDRDPEVKKISDDYKKKYLNRFEFQNIKFSDILKLEKKISNLRGIIFDLGYSINQIKDKSKGLSFNSISKLNMQMGLNNISADEVINKMPQKNIEKILKFFGDESKSKIISKIIEKERKNKNLNTKDLVDIINRVKKRQGTKIHNATKSFQALRIFVNEEISELIYGLINSFKILPIGGVMAVVSFHSIEDKIVKYFFKYYSEKNKTSRYLPMSSEKKILFNLSNKKPIVASNSEIKLNPPSRSAKLRSVVKINETENFDDFLKKFSYLLDIERLREQI